jgi:ribonuclease HII
MIGIDEVGRGCWAGPLLVVVARQTTELPHGLDDSKKLSKKRRQGLFYDIQLSCDVGEGWVESGEIDKLGLTNAMKLGVARALGVIKALPHETIIMDGNINYCAPEFTKVTCVIKGDSEYPIVSAASIYAKVLRDKKMTEYAGQYPEYSFESHVGYGTKTHSDALKKHGICELHRKSFKPIREFV